MISLTTVNYSDIYPGPIPKLGQVLEGIHSKAVIVLMAVVNAELNGEADDEEIQVRISGFMTKDISGLQKSFFQDRLRYFASRKPGGPVTLWAKRYALALMEYEFENFRDTGTTVIGPDAALNILKAYLIITEELNEKDRLELILVTNTLNDHPATGKFFFEKLVWPFLLQQWDMNNRVDPVYEYFRLLAFIKYSLTDELLINSWKEFISSHGFETLRVYLTSVYQLIKITTERFPDRDFKVFSWLEISDTPKHWVNMSLTKDDFIADPSRKIDYKGIREKPLFQVEEQKFVILDHHFLNNKIYNGLLFDFYNRGSSIQSRFKKFLDFKTHVSSNVSEKFIFNAIFRKLFAHRKTILQFDESAVDGHPDLYLRNGDKIFLIEFKDYLFPGKIVEAYSFDTIKEHVDLKFVKNEKGKNKGVSQIVEQLKMLSEDKFPFDQFKADKNIAVYPIIVHTNFTYQLPGINHYLNEEFRSKIQTDLPNQPFKLYDLTLINLEVFFDMLQLVTFDITQFESWLFRYKHILLKREKQLVKEVNRNNFVRARASFDDIFSTVIRPELESVTERIASNIFYQVLKLEESMYDAF